MAGIYLHIPFCKQACHYCNFHFSTSLKYKSDLLEAMLWELEARKKYLGEKASIESIYFGGGTPSLLSEADLLAFFEVIYRDFTVSEKAEITLEANPDDLSREKLKMLGGSPVNRLSIGIQSFSEVDLRFFNRAHTAEEAERCVGLARDAGFENLTLDLIYGSPTTTDNQWKKNVDRILHWQIPHLSCYALTVEPRTALAHHISHGKVPSPDDEQSARQFQKLMDWMEGAGYEHYEISNFALPGRRAVHNSNYWLGKPYLGIGPSAHSFNGESRQWSLSHNPKYMASILEEAKVPFEQEPLNAGTRYNEYVMTRLRTTWGCRVEEISAIGPAYAGFFRQQISPFQQAGHVILEDSRYKLARSGKLLADRIAMECFWVD